MLHELIDREDPRCLYCKSKCDIKLESGRAITLGFRENNVEILSCKKCKETFEIYWFDDCDVDAFVFTCKTIAVLCVYDLANAGANARFYIGTKRNLWPSHFNKGLEIDIPPFDVDFSDKTALHKKLKTYRLFV